MRSDRIKHAAEAAKGPDWVDVGTYLKNLMEVHGVSVRFELAAGPGFYIGAVQLTAVATAPYLTAPGRVWSVRISEAFPGHKHKTLEAVAYYLCHKVDHECSKQMWRQESFV